ncbi:MAG: hypothetical protein EA352_00170 [Gemmatimonadales bacterium]|nr:MAG: hypothetical protein EA352_00170 [Gemmatimonadales bacterium]
MRTHLQAAVSAVLLPAVALLLAACGQATPEDDPATGSDTERILETHEFEDAEVTRVHREMVAAMAPDAGWERTRYLEFDWGVARGAGEPPLVRSHRLDRWEGRARAEFDSEAGRVVALFDLDEPRAGRVWLDTSEVTGEDAVPLLERAHSAHINDAYWLLMPYKWTDPGVHARYVGQETAEDGRTFDVVELSFEDDTGLTPRNMYRAFVNTETGLMERWHFLRDAEANPSPSDWTHWTRVGPIQLALNRESGGQTRIFFSHVLAKEEVPEGTLVPPTYP